MDLISSAYLGSLSADKKRGLYEAMTLLAPATRVYATSAEEDMRRAGFSRKECVAARLGLEGWATMIGDGLEALRRDLGLPRARCVVNHDCDPGRPWRCIKEPVQ